MREMSGLTTSTVPGSMRAGIWNVSDFPAPVGMTPMQSRPPITVAMIFSWPGRKSSYPNTPRSTSRGARSGSCAEESIAVL